MSQNYLSILESFGIVRGSIHFSEALSVLKRLKASEASDSDIEDALKGYGSEIVAVQSHLDVEFSLNLDAETEDERINYEAVKATMLQLCATPVVRKATVLPDACPAGRMGEITVGGVIATENALMPGAHSSDTCCSVMMTNLGADVDPKDVLDTASKTTHFGAGGRSQGDRFELSSDIISGFLKNPFLDSEKLMDLAQSHLGTQGDGNHFLYVGRLESTGEVCLVTHHGSRAPGAMLYKKGMEVAERYRKALCPEIQKSNAWIPFDTQDGADYWQALQLMRIWTKANHSVVHQAICDRLKVKHQDRFWNEHNFVFERDGLFYHGKGATPAWKSYAEDATGLTLIPLNMSAPILIAAGLDNPNALGFAPHGAGRNFSRNKFFQRTEGISAQELLDKECAGLDIRFHCGEIDKSELPSSYKNAREIEKQINGFGLAEIVDKVQPYGCIMAGKIDYRKFQKIKSKSSSPY